MNLRLTDMDAPQYTEPEHTATDTYLMNTAVNVALNDKWLFTDSGPYRGFKTLFFLDTAAWLLSGPEPETKNLDSLLPPCGRRSDDFRRSCPGTDRRTQEKL